MKKNERMGEDILGIKLFMSKFCPEIKRKYLMAMSFELVSQSVKSLFRETSDCPHEQQDKVQDLLQGLLR